MERRGKDGPRCDTALDGEYQPRATTREERPRFPLRKVYDPFTIDTTVQRK